jgi:hypothetical protein
MGALANYRGFSGSLSDVEKKVCQDLLAWETRSAIAAQRRVERIAERVRRLVRHLSQKSQPG